MIKFHCPHCDQKIGLPQQYAGKQVRCAKCRQTILVPAAGEQADTTDRGVIRFECSGCGQKLKVSQKYAGRQFKCPKCSAMIVVPQLTDVTAQGASSTGSTVADELFDSRPGEGDFIAELEALDEAPPAQQESSPQFQLSSEGASGSIRCSSCGAIHSAGRKFCTLCGQSLTTGVSNGPGQARDEAEAAEVSGKGNIVLAILVSIVFAVIGGIIWCIAAKLIGTGWMSFMAVVVCCLAGAGFYLCTQSRSVGVGILAGMIGFVGILNGKTLIAKYVVLPQMKKFVTESAGQFSEPFGDDAMKDKFYEEKIKDDDLMFAMATMQLAEDGYIEEELVDEILASRLAHKKDLEKSEQVRQAEQKINEALNSWGKKKRMEVAEAQYSKVSSKHVNLFMESGVGKTAGFIGAWLLSLSCQDFVWFPLGVFCAYKVARGED
jgi:DNA-directed RNA polymerase subunit RPC12/RpoP